MIQENHLMKWSLVLHALLQGESGTDSECPLTSAESKRVGMNGFANKYLTPGRSQMWSSHKIDNSMLRRYKRAVTHNYI